LKDMGLRSLSDRSKAVALVASLALHAATLAGARLMRDGAVVPRTERPLVPIAVDWVAHGDVLQPGLPGDPMAVPQKKDERQASSGVAGEPRPDTRDRGRGGTPESTEVAHRLSQSVDGLTLATDPSTLAPSNQMSRIHTSDDRLSREDRRRTPNPMELTFLASGTGHRRERLEPARSDPASGALGAVPHPEGARAGDMEPTADGFRPIVVGAVDPGDKAVRALGVERGSRREEYRRTAAVAMARPSVRAGRASVQTTEHGRPDDTVDSSLEVSDVVQALISASSAGGPLGRGPGGEVGGRLAGNDGVEGAGASARPSGVGDRGANTVLGVDLYAAGVARKVYPFWENAFPEWALIRGRGGVAIVGVTILADGTVRDIHIVRASGVPEFDKNVAHALELASPFGPLPGALRRTGLELHIAFDAVNPGVGRLGPGPGRR
jgi:TonB family protein